MSSSSPAAGRGGRPLVDMRHLQVRNDICSQQNQKRINEMRKISKSRVEACEREMEEMRQRFVELRTAQKSKTALKSAPINSAKISAREVTAKQTAPTIARTKKVVVTKPRSNSDTSATTGGGGGGVKKKRSPVKRGGSAAGGGDGATTPNRRVSHSYCEAVVYDPSTEQSRVTAVSGWGSVLGGVGISVSAPSTPPTVTTPAARARSISMFEVVRELVPGIGTGEQISEGEGEQSLNEALLQLGETCPYKDLLQGQ